MSGTSLDGIDAALVDFSDEGSELSWTLERFTAIPYATEQRQAIHDAIVAGSAEKLCRLHAQLGEWLADAVHALCSSAGLTAADVALIGSHGQTVWHVPPSGDQRGSTLQLGCPATIAERTGIPVVSDFRTRDMAAFGQGAPLVPWADRLLFASPRHARILLNIGGMANLSWVPPRGSDEPLLAFDTGPGNALIDAAVELATDGEQSFDRNGEFAAAGSIHEDLLEALLAHSFFRQPPPRSTGRETFGRPFVTGIVGRNPPVDRGEWADLIATLTAFTARSIADATRRWALPRGVSELVITGGGAHNPVLVHMLQHSLAPLPVRTGHEVGIDPDAKEAIAFAGLAWAHLRRMPGNVPAATGAAGPRVLGSWTPGAKP
jgi:anhydro-N-acetylmuramic acid kinase